MCAQKSANARIALFLRNILTVAPSSHKSLAYYFADKSTPTNMKCEVLISHVLKFSSLSPALEKFLDSFTNLLKIKREFNINFPISYLGQTQEREVSKWRQTCSL